jgi:hypothetical protein
MTILRVWRVMLLNEMRRWRSIEGRSMSAPRVRMLWRILLSQDGREICFVVQNAGGWWFWIVIIGYDGFGLSRRRMPGFPATRVWHLVMSNGRSCVGTLSRSIVVVRAAM